MIEFPIIIWYRSKEPSMKALRYLDMIPELFEQKTKKSTKIFSLIQYSILTKEMATFESYRIQQSALSLTVNM